MVSLDTGVAFGATDNTITYRAKIVVPGDPGLTSEMEQISRLVSKQGQVESEFTLRRRAVSDIARLKAAAQAAVYYDVGLTYDLDTKNRPWLVTVKVELGVPYRLRKLRVLTPQGAIPPLAGNLDPGKLGLELGMRAQSAPIL